MTSAARRLVLLRHAKAEHSGSISDELRALEPRGVRQCAAVGAGLRAVGLIPELVLVSTALRARQTWECVASALGYEPDPEVELSDALYGARADEVIGLVRGTDDRVRTLMVVGHEPAMSATAARLAVSGDPKHLSQVRLGLPTASYAVLDLSGPWSSLGRTGVVLSDVVRPAWRE
jgi:phosphohistidine phosphatase